MSFDRWLLAAQPATQRNHLLKTQPAPAIEAIPHCCRRRLSPCPAPHISSLWHRLHLTRARLGGTAAVAAMSALFAFGRKEKHICEQKRWSKRIDIVKTKPDALRT